VSGRVLIVDDDRSFTETLELALGKRGFRTTACTSASDALLAAANDEFDVVLTDLNMKETGGIELCERLVQNRPDMPVIVITAFGSLDGAVGAIRAGAYDFISKPVQTDALVIALDRAIRTRELKEEVKRLREEAKRAPRVDTLVGQSPAMQRIYDLIDRVATSDASVLVTGESGTGKEVVARAIHDRSRRAQRPYVAINCAAMPEALLESELFGHVRGAFTDAKESHAGLFQQAEGGTLFLDEIGDMPLGLQPKLLRALQERTVRPIGGRTEIAVDVRIVAATNRDLESAVEEKRFREDLYFRINVIHLALPPLRARAGDVLPLAQHFIAQFVARTGKSVLGLSPAAAEKLLSYDWPGNVRELANCVERAVALTRYDQIAVDDLPEKIRDYRRSHLLLASDDPSELVPMEEVERRYIRRVMEAVQGNKTAAARILGMDRKRLYRMLDRLEIEAKKGGT
jgi:two-component system response regulator HydG